MFSLLEEKVRNAAPLLRGSHSEGVLSDICFLTKEESEYLELVQ
jgi:hypothetical protein